jgi:hypothetical protein
MALKAQTVANDNILRRLANTKAIPDLSRI